MRFPLNWVLLVAGTHQQTNKQTNKQTDRRTDRQTDNQSIKQTNKTNHQELTKSIHFNSIQLNFEQVPQLWPIQMPHRPVEKCESKSHVFPASTTYTVHGLK